MTDSTKAGAWTPGPWSWSGPDYEKEHEPPDCCASWGLSSETDSVLSGCGNCGNIFYKEADGRLIAAAPDMAAALEALLSDLPEMEHVGAAFYAAVTDARNALAKAKGTP